MVSWADDCIQAEGGTVPRKTAGLTAAGVRTAAPGKHFDGDGLILHVQSGEAAYWLFRYTMAGKTRERGLGRARGRSAVPLAEARGRAAELRRAVKSSVDPLARRDADAAAARAAEQAERIQKITFRAVSERYLHDNEVKWKNAKHRQQWRNTLDTYVMPTLGDLPVAEVNTGSVIAVLQPIWQAKPETASRLRGRIESVLSYAATCEWRSKENPARWRGHLDHILPARAKVRAIKHHAALPWHEIGAFMTELRNQGGVGARALEFTILTAARTGETIGARWPENDLRTGTWTIPPERMKAGKEHRVPLSDAALAVLHAVETLRQEPGDFVFPGQVAGRPLSNMTMSAVLRRMGRGDLTVHGFRSAFRDWCAEATGYPGELAEAALAHAVKGKVEAAYRRGDLFEKRRRLMDEWATFCGRPEPAKGEVVHLHNRSAA